MRNRAKFRGNRRSIIDIYRDLSNFKKSAIRHVGFLKIKILAIDTFGE